jgi:hypothetical protein
MGESQTMIAHLSQIAQIGVLCTVSMFVLLIGAIRSRNMQYWLWSYVRSRWASSAQIKQEVVNVYVCMSDHYEPYGGGTDHEKAAGRVAEWVRSYPAICAKHRDSVGRPPQHTFFYPLEEYEPQVLDQIAGLCRKGFGDVEVHYHHDNDTAEALERELRRFCQVLHNRHGLLRKDPGSDEIGYCFIHGNWALDNSRPDGRFCGVNNELSVLVRTGCKVDYSMPSAPDNTQTRKINSIYFAKGSPGQCKSHDSGRDADREGWARPGELLLVQGPLGLNWRSRKLGLFPRIENGEVSADAPPTLERLKLWLQLAPRIRREEGHIFIKLHTHGATDSATKSLLGGDLEKMWSLFAVEVRDRPGFRLMYVSAWEMYEKIHSLVVEPS